MARVVACFEVVERVMWTPDECADAINEELRQRHIDADQVISIAPIMDTTAMRVFFWTNA
jgi:hypothetical protein